MATPDEQLRELRWHWNELGKRDPFWAILTVPGKQGGKWDEGEFFAVGREGIEHVFQLLEAVGAVPRPGRALDFGCGMGRLTQALALRFREVVGVDISDSMIRGARDRARHLANVRFELNPRPDLSTFADGRFDLALTILVLQHVPKELIAGYLDELLRVTAPGGVLVFQLPSPLAGGEPESNPEAPAEPQRSLLPRALVSWLREMKERRTREPRMEMNGLSGELVAERIAAGGGELLGKVRDTLAGPGWDSFTYVVRKGA